MSASAHRLTRIRSFAAALIAATQFAVVGFGPLVDGLQGASAPAHVEEFGIHLHYSHDPDNCAACAASHMVGDAPRVPVPALQLAAHRDGLTIAVVSPTLRRDGTPKSPRAPPRSAAAAR
jgi:hypothetical protein